MEKELLDRFGKLLMEKVRDESITTWDMIIDGRMKGDRAAKLRSSLSSFSKEHKEVANNIIPQIVDTVLHNFLLTVEQQKDLDVIIKDKLGNGCNIRDQSDGLPAELYTEEGWISRFSNQRYIEP